MPLAPSAHSALPLQITFLRFSATTLPPAAEDHPGSIRSNHVETVEYDWGKARSEGSSPREEGVRTVAGLPLEVLGESAPPSILDEEGGLILGGSRSLKHKTSSGSKMSLSRKPSLSTVDERRTRRPIASTSPSASPGATLLGIETQSSHSSPSRAYASPHHTPRILDSSPTPSGFPFPFASPGEGERGSPVARGRRLGRRSHDDLRYGGFDSAGDNRFDEVKGVSLGASARTGRGTSTLTYGCAQGSLDISSPIPSEHTLLASARFSPPGSPSRGGHSRRMESLERISSDEAVPSEAVQQEGLRRSGGSYEGVGTSSW